jgi:hypothetical protein
MNNPASSQISVNDGSVLVETSVYLDDLDPLGLLHNGMCSADGSLSHARSPARYALGGVDRRNRHTRAA